jgi:general secretion pathway protein D
MIAAAGISAALLGAPVAALAQSAPPDEVRVDMNLKDADMLAATKVLTAQTGLQFVLEPSDMQFPKITLQLHAVTAEEAIQYICQAAGAVFRKDENGVYLIGHKKVGDVGSITNVTPAPPAPKSPVRMHKFKLMHADASSVMSQLDGRGPTNSSQAFYDLKNFNRLIGGYQTPAGPQIYMMNTAGPSGAAFQPVNAQTYSSPKTFTESGSDVALPGETANQIGGLGGGGNFGGAGGGGQFGGGGGGGQFGGGGGGGLGGGGQGGGGQGGALPRGGAGTLIPQTIQYITFDPVDNSIIVNATDEEIRELQDAITFFDVAPKQVSVKVEFITTDTSLLKDFGADLTYSRGNVIAGVQPGTFTQAADPIFANFATGNILFALRTRLETGEGKVVNAPVIRTLNNEPATVTASTTSFIFTSQTISIGNGNVITQLNATPITAGTSLSVRPRINEDGTITMFLQPQVSSFGSLERAPDGSEFPTTDSQAIAAVARVRSGETVALAGFTAKSDLGSSQRFPILGDLPIIGQFFRSQSKNITNNELIIFVTPTVIDEENNGLTP